MQPFYQRTFAGGELAPALRARADLVKYVTGLARCRNFLVMREGGVTNRAGFRLVEVCQTQTPGTRLHVYLSELAGDSLLLECAPSVIRFYRQGAQVHVAGVGAWDVGTDYTPGDLVVHGGVHYYCIAASTGDEPPDPDVWHPLEGTIFEVPHPFGAAGFAVAQSGRILTLTSEDGTVRPHELEFLGLTHWILRPVSTVPGIAAPTNLQGTPGDAGSLTFGYVVTAAGAGTFEESLGSLVQVANAAEPTPDAPIALTWDAVSGAAEYYIYGDPYENGVFGFLGSSSVASFRDPGFIPDFAITPPIPRILFASSGHYPRRATYYQQRRFFAHTRNDPDAIWASRVGFHGNFTISSPLQDDDALEFRLAGHQAHPVRHLIGLKQLVALTDGGAWSIGQPKEALTPSNLPADQETYAGAADVPPAAVGNALIYVQARGSFVRDLQFDREVEGFAGRDLTVYASHLFQGFTIRRLAYQAVPQSVVWALRSDGVLLGLTYLPEEDVWGWHRHDTDGVVEDLAVVPELDQDALYVVVRRTIGGQPRRYLERLEARQGTQFFVDSGLTYTGPPADVISGLEHLEGRFVAVVGDGTVVYDGVSAVEDVTNFRVTDGAITLPAAYRVVHVGLPITAEIETLELDVSGSALRDKRRRIGALSLLLALEGAPFTFQAGPDAGHLRRYRPQPFDPTAPEEVGQVSMSLASYFSESGRVRLRHTDPLPLTILGLIPHVEVGG